MQVFLGKLLAIGSSVDGVLQDEFVARHIFRRGIRDLLQRRQHLAFGRSHFLHAEVQVDLALQRVVRHGVDGLDDVRVVLQRVVNQRGAAGFLLAQELLQQGQALAGELDVQLQALVRLLRFADLIDLVRRQEIAVLRERPGRENANHCQNTHGYFSLRS